MPIGIYGVLDILIERQKSRQMTGKLSGHIYLFIADRKMNKAAFESKQRLFGVSVILVLLDRLFNKLSCQTVFKFSRYDW